MNQLLLILLYPNLFIFNLMIINQYALDDNKNQTLALNSQKLMQHNTHCNTEPLLPGEVIEVDLTQKKNWVIVHNSTPTSNRRRISSNNRQISVQHKQAVELPTNCPKDLLHNETLNGKKDQERESSLASVQKSSWIPNKNSCPVDSSKNKFGFLGVGIKKQNYSKKTQRKQFLEGSSEEIPNEKNDDSSRGSFLTQIIYSRHTQKKMKLQENNETEKNKTDNEMILGIQSDKNGSGLQFLNIESKVDEHLEIKLESKISEGNMNFMKKKQNASVYVPMSTKFLQVPKEQRKIFPCQKCGYQIQITESFLNVCRICFLLEHQQNLISFKQEQPYSAGTDKRKRAKTLLKGFVSQGKLKPFQDFRIKQKQNQNQENAKQQKKKSGFRYKDRNQLKINSLEKMKLRPKESSPLHRLVERMRSNEQGKLQFAPNQSRTKCANPQCNQVVGTLIRFQGKSYCLKCFYERKEMKRV